MDYVDNITKNMDILYEFLNVDGELPLSEIFPMPPLVLVTPYRSSIQKVDVLMANRSWRKAFLFIAQCNACLARYYPDKILLHGNVPGRGSQILVAEAKYLRISKHGLWADRSITLDQEESIVHHSSGWSNFVDFLNARMSGKAITFRQSQRLFVEHFSRRLLVSHRKESTFRCPSNATTDILVANGGTVPGAMEHSCMDCTHKNGDPADNILQQQNLARDISPPEGPRGYTRMAVIDGKTMKHRICSVQACKNPLTNYKRGRFCKLHLEAGMEDICGIHGTVTCADPSHQAFYRKWSHRFQRMTFPGIQRAMEEAIGQDLTTTTLTQNQFRIQLPDLGGVTGNDVVHTFRARSIYCLQTVQWSCGMPIGWGKCYAAESPTQVHAIIDRIWDGHHEHKLAIIAYDSSCKLLRHIMTQNPNDHWLSSTKFIVDAWHYIGHKATDVLCRDGSQPDLVQVHEDSNGTKHLTWAFNTKTAEQFNSWLAGFESQLRQMSNINYDFYIHSLMLLYKEKVEQRIQKKERGLTQEFWDKVLE
ncbi:uncharacterized protein EV420DRAFT_1733676 [Desarmillaria tabescens]|uniref:CxC6 like cysteine cluster associated with KDZ domain-containing protein n=1 Tax=Armillaria tabescens TaxID=1929756 RepID=A0AA39JBB4_ARMTA|nr:uncharacterized protein EV420DRAFT_1733676 [Desarmillaria tabescens]KAK0439478.1 hypothetical protein EV420DRAFT_1733676 [Desarmillaria tabescens]